MSGPAAKAKVHRDDTDHDAQGNQYHSQKEIPTNHRDAGTR